MERRGYWQRLGHLGATGLAGLHGAFDCSLVASDHGLTVGVEIDWFDDLTLGGLGAGSSDACIVQAEDGRHSAGTDRDGFLHRSSTQANKGNSIFQINDASGNQCRVFPQAMSCQDGRYFATFFLPQAPHGDASGQHHRLGVDRLRERFGRAFGDHRPQVVTECSRGFVKSGAYHSRVAVGRHHANALRALAGKYECKRHGFVLLEFKQGSAPGKAAADAFDQHLLAALDAPVAHSFVERQRHRGCGSVAMTIDSHDDLVAINPQLLAGGFNDPDVRLVRNQPVDIGRRDARTLADFLGDIGQDAYGELENGLPVHAQEWVAGHLAAADLTGYVQDAVLTAVGMHGRSQDTRFLGSFEHNGAGPITKQHAGATVFPVKNAGEDLCADDQGFLVAARADELLGNAEGG